jgi:HAD superfamily hydrolase (TIGR01509 family)
MPQHPAFDLLVFDLGGVLVENVGVDLLLSWMSTTPTPEEIWRTWLTSPTVRAFESGTLPAAQFATGMIAELSLPVSPEEFLTEFAACVKQLYPGALDLLRHLSQSYRLASLSNTNGIHWQRCCDEMQLASLFHYNFPSHETGRLKPDREAFQHVIEHTGCLPERILFVDDNQLNVDSAAATGMVARKTVGIAEVQEVLREFGIVYL